MIDQSPVLQAAAATNKTRHTILSFCTGIYQLLGRNFKSDCYKWILFNELKHSGFSCQMCGATSAEYLYTDVVKVTLPEDEPVYVIVRAEEGLNGTEQLSQQYPGFLQPDHSLVVNFGHESFEYRML